MSNCFILFKWCFDIWCLQTIWRVYFRYIYPNVWTHLVFVWNRVTRKGNLYLNGIHAGETASTYQGQDIDLNLTNHTTYELGFKKDTKEVIHGFLRDLMVFVRPLTSGEVFTLYSKLCNLNNILLMELGRVKYISDIPTVPRRTI